MPEYILSPDGPIQLKAYSAKKIRGTRLPGALFFRAETDHYLISVQEFAQDLYTISYRSLQFSQPAKLITREAGKGLRLEAVLTGELHIRDHSGQVTHLVPGHYHLTESPDFQADIAAGTGCTYFVINFSRELLSSLGRLNWPSEADTRPIPHSMLEVITAILQNPYDENVRTFFYENRLRDILFEHLSARPASEPGEFTAKEMASIYQADRMISENLNDHLSIRDLARKAGTNAYILKKGFQQVFEVGVFGRLLQLRMEKAKLLLEKTDKPIKEVCDLAGYETVAGFITAFRKRFGTTPREWRRQSRSQSP